VVSLDAQHLLRGKSSRVSKGGQPTLSEVAPVLEWSLMTRPLELRELLHAAVPAALLQNQD